MEDQNAEAEKADFPIFDPLPSDPISSNSKPETVALNTLPEDSQNQENQVVQNQETEKEETEELKKAQEEENEHFKKKPKKQKQVQDEFLLRNTVIEMIEKVTKAIEDDIDLIKNSKPG